MEGAVAVTRVSGDNPSWAGGHVRKSIAKQLKCSGVTPFYLLSELVSSAVPQPQPLYKRPPWSWRRLLLQLIPTPLSLSPLTILCIQELTSNNNMLLQKYPTLPNFAAYSHPSVATEHWTSCKSLSNRYANSDSGKGAGTGGIDVDDDDTEMTSFSSSPTSSSHSPRSAATPSVKDELLLQEVIHPFPYSYPASTGSSGSKSKLQRMNAVVSLTPEDIIPVPVAPHVAPPSACAEFDEHWARERDEESLASVDPAQLSEWESNGGLLATQAAFEGQLLFDSDLDSASEWLAPIVWKMYLRQATQCSARFRHQYDVPLETPCPAYFPKLLTRAMPRYRGGMTRAIAITHALLYLHRIKTCFHCTTVSSTSNTPFKQQKVKYQRYSSSSSTSASSSPNCINNNNDNAPLPEETLSKEQYQKAITNVAAQCSLFFAVGMHYASLWLLDCCPGEKTYWKRYVQCVQTSHGIAWSRLVLQHWNYQINVSIEDWLIFCSQLLAKFPYVNDEARTRMNAKA